MYLMQSDGCVYIPSDRAVHPGRWFPGSSPVMTSCWSPDGSGSRTGCHRGNLGKQYSDGWVTMGNTLYYFVQLLYCISTCVSKRWSSAPDSVHAALVKRTRFNGFTDIFSHVSLILIIIRGFCVYHVSVSGFLPIFGQTAKGNRKYPMSHWLAFNLHMTSTHPPADKLEECVGEVTKSSAKAAWHQVNMMHSRPFSTLSAAEPQLWVSDLMLS